MGDSSPFLKTTNVDIHPQITFYKRNASIEANTKFEIMITKPLDGLSLNIPDTGKPRAVIIGAGLEV